MIKNLIVILKVKYKSNLCAAKNQTVSGGEQR
jgi:hypothetical protein